MIERFKLGYSGALPKSIAVPDLIECGLVRKDKNSERLFPFFRDAVVFPVMKRGRCIHMTARLITPIEKENGVKLTHLHLPGGIGAFWNEDAITNSNTIVVITEAPMDSLSWEVAGIRSVGMLGCSGLQERHLDRVSSKRLFVLGLDKDSAGVKHTDRIGELLIGHCDQCPHVITYPDEYKDANQILATLGTEDGTMKLLESLESMVSFPVWRFNRCWPAAKLPIEKQAIVRFTAGLLAMCDPIDHEMSVMQIAESTGIGVDVLKKQIGHMLLKQTKGR